MSTRRVPEVPLSERLLLSCREASRYSGISRDHLYWLARSGQLPALRVGCKWLIRRADLERWVEEQLAAHEAAVSIARGAS